MQILPLWWCTDRNWHENRTIIHAIQKETKEGENLQVRLVHTEPAYDKKDVVGGDFSWAS